MRLFSVVVAVTVLGVASSAFAQAPAFPMRPVRIIVPFPPGGTSDAAARMVADRLTMRWEKPVIVDNRAGAGGNIAAAIAARATADGYTLFVGFHGTHAVNISLFKKLDFDPERDFSPITLMLTVPNLFLVHPSLPVSSVKELIALARATPAGLNYASSGYGTMTHMTGALFAMMAGVEMVPVLYKGSGPAMIDVLAGQVKIMSESLLTSLPHYRARKLRAIGITSAERNPTVPEVPTISEAGLPGFLGITWVGLLVPSATPKVIVELLHKEIASILRSKEMRDRLAQMGATSGGGTPEEFSSFMRSETNKWAKVVRAANMTVN